MLKNSDFVARKAIEELVKGREFAIQLRQVINGGGYDDNDGNSEQLMKKVIMSFTSSLLILNNPSSELLEEPSTKTNPTKSEDSLESNCKSFTSKDRRGCYKRRRTSQSWENESEAPLDDGHQWRKYGQKVILNAKHPRNYYRCTHKYDQGCQATKQVQRIQDEPSPLYKTTYYGNHTCRNFMINPELILNDSNDNDFPNSDNNSSVFISFGNNKQNFTSTTFLTSYNDFPQSSAGVKEECKEEIKPSLSSSNDYNNLLSSDLTFDNYSNHHATTTLSSNLDCDDVISGALYDHEFDGVFEPFFEF